MADAAEQPAALQPCVAAAVTVARDHGAEAHCSHRLSQRLP
jgi:hypothetical protein